MNFKDLGLAEPLLRAVGEQGYDTPTPIQAQAIPAVLQGGDLLAGAQTGTGKTAGFTLPLLQRLSVGKPVRDARGRAAIRALILTPTRELAAQVEESVRTYGKYLPLTSMVMFGGVGMQPQVDKLRRGVDILVATPGRLLDHHQQGTLDLSHVQIFVLDEADRMLDMGFIHDIKKVLAIVPAKKQSLLFSATFSDEIKALADKLLNQPALIEVARRNATAEKIAQKVHPVGRERKKELLAHLIKTGDWHQVLVFTRMKHGCEPPDRVPVRPRHQRDGDPRQQEPGRAHEGAGRVQDRRPAACWWPPTSPRAASTSTSCRTSSTSSCRTCPRTTCTASGARGAPAPLARPSRWCAWTRRSSCKRHPEASSSASIPVRGGAGLRGRRCQREAPNPSCWAA